MRLTKEIKRNIREAAVKAAMAKKTAALKKRAADLGDRVYEDYYGVYLQTISKLPETFFNRHEEADLEWRTDRRHTLRVEMSRCRPFAAIHRPYYTPTVELTRPDFIAAATKLKEDWKAFAVLENELRSKIQGLLAPITTLKRLREIWPEGEPFFPGEQTIVNAPMVVADEVNELMKEVMEETI